jgi:deoxycytidylate deaminase
LPELFIISILILIEDVRNGEKSPENLLSTDELIMTIAYSLSKMSSCLKRKVGAVIINNHKLTTGSEHNQTKLTSMPFILSSGYNEVPLGSFKCIFNPEYQKCYRDYLKETYAIKLKHCPNCGKKINIKYKCSCCGKIIDKYLNKCEQCGKEIDIKTLCKKCNTEIFREYLPGSAKAPGKVLDMCRALHAEENALLNLPKINLFSEINMVLYTTTQPCNLCANKIVSAGIKEVVFAEPYLMKESAEILEAGNEKWRRFEGVKSSAYFKLYQ